MKIVALSIAALSLVAAAAPAAADPAGTAAAASSSQAYAAGDGSQAAAKPEKKFCRRFDNSARRTQNVTLCLTRDQWKKFDEQQD